MCKFKPIKVPTTWIWHNDLAITIDGIMVGPWRGSEEIQITAETYIESLKEHLERCSSARELHSGER